MIKTAYSEVYRSSYCHDWTSALESGQQVDVIYLGLQKAFDKVPHARLLSKLESYGIRGKLLQWIKIFYQIGDNVCVCEGPNQIG